MTGNPDEQATTAPKTPTRSLLGRVREAVGYVLGTREAIPYGVTVDSEGQTGFRRLSAVSEKELTHVEWQRQMSIAHYLWQNNPVAYRIIELFTDFVVGDGVTVTAKDPRVQERIDRFWDDPDNAMDMLMFERAQELGLMGTWMVKPFVNKVNGDVKLSPVDPAWVTKIVPDKDRAGRAYSVEVVIGVGSGPGTWKVISPQDQNPNAKDFGMLSGDVFYFPVNKLTYTVQGISDIYRQADWIDAFDQFLFHALERIVFLNAHLYEITITGGGDGVVKKRAQELAQNPPKSGGFRVHDEKEKWEALAPKINSAEVEEMGRMVKMLILGTAGIPEHWFGQGGDVNRAASIEMGTPIFRKLKRRQAYWVEVLSTLVDFQIDQAILYGTLPADVNREFEIKPSEISPRAVKDAAGALVSLTDALIAAVDAGFARREDAIKLWASQATELGVEVKPMTDAESSAAQAAQAAARATKADGVEGEVYRSIRPAPKSPAPNQPAAASMPAHSPTPTPMPAPAFAATAGSPSR